MQKTLADILCFTDYASKGNCSKRNKYKKNAMKSKVNNPGQNLLAIY